MPVKGLKVCTPTSIAYSGTSASINSDGSVSFTACSSLSLNGVFTSNYDNYMVTVRGTSFDDGGGVSARLRASGSDATGSNYAVQRLDASGTSVSGGRAAVANYTRLMVLDNDLQSGGTAFIYGPYLAQPTAFRGLTASAYLNGFIRDWASTHSLSTSYDGITLANEFGTLTITGLVSVAGWVQ